MTTLPQSDASSALRPSSNLHVVLGLGAVGRAVVQELTERGLRARAVARHRPSDLAAGVEFVAADLTDRTQALGAMDGAAVVYHAASAPYHRWPEMLPSLMEGVIAGASKAGARVVYADNLYAYGEVDGRLSEDLPATASGVNGRVRARLAARLMSAHASGTVRATIGRASDYYGAHGRQSSAGERLFSPALAGRAAQLLGNPELPHTYTYLPDFARGLVTLGMSDTAFGEVWHVPSAPTISTREFVELVYDAVGQPAKLQVLPSPILAVLSVFSPGMRAVREQQYQRTRPWIVDHAKFERTFGAQVTPHREAIAETLDWYRRAAQTPADREARSSEVREGAR